MSGRSEAEADQFDEGRFSSAASTNDHIQTCGQFKVKSIEKSFFDLYSFDMQRNLTNAT